MSNKAKNKKGIQPKLRFPEFKNTAGWTKVGLNKIAAPVVKKAKSDAKETVLTLSGEHGLIHQGEYFGKKIAGDKTERYIKITRNDFVYNDRTTKASTYGTIKRLSKHASGIVSPIYKCFRFNKGENPEFWDQYFESGSHQVALHSLINEGARAGRFNISIDRFLSTMALRPEWDEQQKIANCLSSLDELIEAEGQKLDALKDHKKGLMQELFPVEGQTLPKRRFPEFQSAPEWERKKIGDEDFASLHKGKGVSKADISPDGKTSCIRYGELYTLYGEVINTVHSKTNCPSSSLFLSNKNDVIIPASGETKIDIATAACVMLDNVALGSDLNVIRSHHNGVFISYYLNGALKKEIAKVAQGDSVVHLYPGQLAKLDILLPSTPEQQRISDFLSSIDDLITAQSQKLDALRDHKKGLMQQLFPAVSEVQE